MVLEESAVITEDIITFLEGTELGTNGAKYTHLDIRDRIIEVDRPISFTLKRNQGIIANVTFCVRDFALYVRYFAFHPRFQSTSKKEKTRNPHSVLAQNIEHVFKKLEAQRELPFYAYIDAENSRSQQMSQRFGFKPYTEILSRTFSRLHPIKVKGMSLSCEWSELVNRVKEDYGYYDGYYDAHFQKPPFVVLRDTHGAIKAYAKFTLVKWKFHRLPGAFGDLLVKALPYIPFLRRLINPKAHFFLCPDIISSGLDAQQLEELFSAALCLYKVNSIIWFVDPNDSTYDKVKDNMSWGALDRIIGTKKVNVMVRNAQKSYSSKRPFFVSSFDLV
jgi:hypothetical protein